VNAKYMRRWRRNHPGYSRAWMQRRRDPDWKPKRSKRVSILGVVVEPNWMPIPAVSKEQAETDFISLTREMS